MQKPILQVKNLSVQFADRDVLSGISFSLERGMALAIIGPNGAGKSVLFRALLGLVPYKGTIEWGRGVRIGYVPQKLALDPDTPLTTLEFLGLRGSRKEVTEATRMVGLQDETILGKRLGTLSGGEAQRVLVASAIMSKPDVLLFDEPVAGIDIAGEGTIYNLLMRLHVKEKLTILLISHDLDIVYRYADLVLCLSKSLICFGSPKEVLTSKSIEELYGSAEPPHHQYHDNARTV